MIKAASTQRSALNRRLATWHGIVVHCEGNITAFSPELLDLKHKFYGQFSIYNFLDDTIEAHANSKKFESINAEINRGIEKCRRECEYVFCCGCAASNKYFEAGTFDVSGKVACRLQHQAVVDVLSD